ncbi:hypothetical protein P171DRAFT_69050 [Karstenula rhodostoma CBS 690.94]|uniref:Uncharacterized protein n=1 Tax=Karstenula rhodostoma CBS 690.94 TaxID=1392251 RepID=A0A9P4PCK5_9PLEO|nr:hypothetical protein P171DRAFT_69050 [Karstenula rhodostoma CBS 690.94]
MGQCIVSRMPLPITCLIMVRRIIWSIAMAVSYQAILWIWVAMRFRSGEQQRSSRT